MFDQFGDMFGDPSNPDKLGIGLKHRARERRNQFEAAGKENARKHGQIVSFGHLGPLRDPQWDAYFQALEEAGVNNIADSSVGARKGMWAPASLESTIDPTLGQTGVNARPGGRPQDQWSSSPFNAVRPSLRGLFDVDTRKRRGSF